MYYGYGYGYDSMYFLVLLAFIFSMVAQMKVSGTFKKYAKIRNRRGLTGGASGRTDDAQRRHL